MPALPPPPLRCRWCFAAFSAISLPCWLFRAIDAFERRHFRWLWCCRVVAIMPPWCFWCSCRRWCCCYALLRWYARVMLCRHTPADAAVCWFTSHFFAAFDFTRRCLHIADTPPLTHSLDIAGFDTLWLPPPPLLFTPHYARYLVYLPWWWCQLPAFRFDVADCITDTLIFFFFSLSLYFLADFAISLPLSLRRAGWCLKPRWVSPADTVAD